MDNDRLRQAIQLIKEGDKSSGGKILGGLVKESPENETAWLWLSVCVKTRDQQIYCLRKVLSINPENNKAKAALAKLTSDAPQPAISKLEESPKAVTVSISPSNQPLPPDAKGTVEKVPVIVIKTQKNALLLWAIVGVLSLGIILVSAFLIYYWRDINQAVVYPTVVEPASNSKPVTAIPGTPLPRRTLPSTWNFRS